jgi:hypothetical protein
VRRRSINRSALPLAPLALAPLVALAAGGCVYPSTEPTGVELSWRFVEHDIEGEEDEGARVRSCEGASAEQIAFEIADQGDPRRQGILRFDCTMGFQTGIELQTSASDAFVRLRPGGYSIAVLVIDDAANAQDFERVTEREVDVGEREVTVELWELRRAPVTWTLELHGADACERLALSLVYASPEIDLPDQAPADEEEPPLLYRSGLRSDRELPVGGQEIACGAGLDGVHRFVGVDRGDYLLELDVDGRGCAVPVDLRGPDGATSVIDLASLPCDG